MKFKLAPRSPFDFDLSAAIFSSGHSQVQSYESGTFWRVVRLSDGPALLSVASLGSADEPLLSIEVECDGPIPQRGKKEAQRIAVRLFNLDLDLLPFYRFIEGDPVMARLTRLLRGLKSPCTETVFEALIESIIEQQISLSAAWSLQRRVILAFGDILQLKDRSYYAFPRAERLAASGLEQLRDCGLSRRKAEYVRDVSRLVAGGLDLEALKGQEESQIVGELSRLRGVGRWTAEMTMIRGMQKLDAFPADDLGLRRAVSHYYHQDRKISPEEALETASAWREWRGLAGFYLIRAEMIGLPP